ncbi:unnamed protein product [Porites evermanni]|uniref:Uncharacterized protein n=1 Tax=Porites evermanni TaxID=104178 RepID=A0ABN8LY95_9CNID|nr:unnamed protein product [Porites evermanni]
MHRQGRKRKVGTVTPPDGLIASACRTPSPKRHKDHGITNEDFHAYNGQAVLRDNSYKVLGCGSFTVSPKFSWSSSPICRVNSVSVPEISLRARAALIMCPCSGSKILMNRQINIHVLVRFQA